ncbi:hypothetical protein HDV05_005679 [Chytridiales sp. JEL 0842]|nr:hypothetical protein HDV05_005679 [Chytridiales sp. JEL 0842]
MPPKVPFPTPSPTPSYWLRDVSLGSTQPFPAAPASDDDDGGTFDVVIVGGGFSGFSTAYHLRRVEPGLRVAVVEARDVAGGATGRNGGLIWIGLSAPLHHLIKEHGLDASLDLLRFEHENIKELREFCERYTSARGDNTLDPLLTRFEQGGISTFETVEEFELAKKDLELLERTLREEGRGDAAAIEIWDAERVAEVTGGDGQVTGVGGLVVKDAYRVVGSRLVLALAKCATGPEDEVMQMKGPPVAYFSECVVTEIQRTSSQPRFLIQTSRGPLRARKVVHATNAWASALLPHVPVTPIRNQVIVTHPKPFTASFTSSGNFSEGTFSLSVKKGYIYLSGRGDGRVVLGGMRYLAPQKDVGNADDGSLNAEVSKGLRGYLGQRFPRDFSSASVESVESGKEGGELSSESGREGEELVDAEWAGVMGWTDDSMPFVGELPFGEGGEYILAGYCGHGMPRCFLAGRAVAEMVTGKEVRQRLPRMFKPTRERMERKAGDFESK